MSLDVAKQIGPAYRLGAHLAHGIARVGVDAALGARRSFPRAVADLDAACLSAVLGKEVESVTVLDGADGTSTRARLWLTGPDVPQTVFVKMPAATAATRMLGELARLAETECRFYRNLAEELGDGVPVSHGSAFDELTGRYVVVLEDMTVSECVFPDTLHPLSADQMAGLMQTLANLHGTFWSRMPAQPGGPGPLGWLWPPSSDPANPLTPMLMRKSAEKLSQRTDIDVYRGRYLWENLQRIVTFNDRGPHVVLHGDSHPGNTFFRNGVAGLLDWQVVRRGHPSRDLAYTLVLGMTPEDRREHQQELLDVYRDALPANGGPQLDRDELFNRYRQGMVYSFVSALTTAGLGGMQTENIALEGLRRSVAAMEDLATVASLSAEMSSQL
ncbi:MAG: phosphotransferase [Mycolicibacterium sp.]|nr:phosphotransferase [Mycolicibacterium sp.]